MSLGPKDPPSYEDKPTHDWDSGDFDDYAMDCGFRDSEAANAEADALEAEDEEDL